jgi:hypothetical protein
MIRFVVLAAVGFAALAVTRADAQPAPGTLQVVDAKIDGRRLLWDETVLVPVQREVEVAVVIDGKTVIQKRTEIVPQVTLITKEAEVKTLKVTDATGKAIDADKLAELLKEKTPVVFVTGSVPEKHRALFKDKTLFVELPAPKK